MFARDVKGQSLFIGYNYHAECGCPAGKGPHGSCKHIALLAYALVDFCKNIKHAHIICNNGTDL